MTRILYWNIQRFSRKKIANPSNAVVGGNGGNPASVAAQHRRQLILDHITAFQPDIFIVVEVSTGNRTPGQLITPTQGRGGCRALGWMLRNLTANNDWRLVPPLQVGQQGPQEGVAVFYRGNVVDGAGAVVGQRYFTGPNRWTAGGENGYSYYGGASYGDYPRPEKNLLMGLAPNNQPREIPGDALHNPGISETTVAARVDRFRDRTSNGFLNFGDFRPPYMTTFTEATDAIRNITLFTVHTPPRPPNAAANFVQVQMPQAVDIMGNLDHNEVKVIVGDFNINLLQANGNLTTDYNNLMAPDGNGNCYVLGLQPLPGWNPVNLDRGKGYFATHIKKAKRAILWSTAAQPRLYPGYEYIGATFGGPNLYSIDNILIKQAAVPVGGNQVTIANSVVGTPLNLDQTPPPGVPNGAVMLGNAFQNVMANVLWPNAPNAPNSQPGLAGNLRGWPNYGRIYSTSDHLALFAVV